MRKYLPFPVLHDTESSWFHTLAQRIPLFSDIGWKINAWGCLLGKVILLQSHLHYVKSNRGQNPTWEVDNSPVIFMFFPKTYWNGFRSIGVFREDRYSNETFLEWILSLEFRLENPSQTKESFIMEVSWKLTFLVKMFCLTKFAPHRLSPALFWKAHYLQGPSFVHSAVIMSEGMRRKEKVSISLEFIAAPA